MKRYTLLFIIYMLVMAGSHAYASHSLKITDYDTTVSGAKATTLNLQYYKDTTMNPYGAEKAGMGMGQIYLTHTNFYDSYDIAWSYELDATRTSMSNNGGITPTNKINQQYYYVDGNYLVYFMPEKDIFHGIGAYWETTLADDDKSPLSEEIEAGISYIVGMGHIVDITPLAEAGVIEDRLNEAGYLNGNISKKDMLKLAEIIRRWRMGEYDDKNRETDKGHFLADISKVLEASGKLTRPLGGFGFWRISEQRTTNYTRRKGERIMFSLAADNVSMYDHSTPGDINSISNQHNYFSINYDRYLPIDWISQFTLRFENTISLNPEDVYPPTNTYWLYLLYTYDLTNNIWLSTSYTYDRTNYQNDEERSNSVSGKLYSLSINYKIEDLSITTLSLEKSSDDEGDSTETIRFTQSFYM